MGGGDGGLAREVSKHATVKEIHICEIDEVSTAYYYMHSAKLITYIQLKKVYVIASQFRSTLLWLRSTLLLFMSYTLWLVMMFHT